MLLRHIVPLFLIAAPGLEAQGNPFHLDGHLLPIRTDSFAVYLIKSGDTAEVGAVEDRLVVRGDSLLRIYSEVNAVIGAIFDTITSSLDDLRPRAYWTLSSNSRASLTYDSTGVNGWRLKAGGDTQAVAMPLPTPTYDGTAYDLVVRSSPLRDSLRLSVPAYLYESATVDTIDGSVTGEERVDGYPCWVFKARFAGMPVTFWIDKENRALRRQLLEIGSDASLLYKRPPRARSRDREV